MHHSRAPTRDAPTEDGWGLQRGKGGSRSLFQKSDLSENWAFWIPAFAGMTDLEVIFHAFAREVVAIRFGMLGINHG